VWSVVSDVTATNQGNYIPWWITKYVAPNAREVSLANQTQMMTKIGALVKCSRVQDSIHSRLNCTTANFANTRQGKGKVQDALGKKAECKGQKGRGRENGKEE